MAVIHASYQSHARNGAVPFSAIIPVEPTSKRRDAGTVYESGPFHTIYLLHGLHGSQDDWLIRTRIEEWAVEKGYAVIMPSGLNRYYLDNADTNEMYGDFTGRELVNVTRTMFNLSTRREDTVIAGLSMGGYGAVRNGLKYRDTFGAIIALSSAFITDQLSQSNDDTAKEEKDYYFYRHVFGPLDKLPGSDKDPKELAKQAKNNNPPKLFIACGTEDFLYQQNEDYHQFLNDIGYTHTYVKGPGIHNWDYWNQTIKEGINWLDEACEED